MNRPPLPLVNHYRELLIADTPMIDVRAPIEFASGALPSAVNLPLMSNDERHRVGICYKEQGQAAAIKLGHSLVTGALKDQRIDAWRAFMAENPSAVLYCARGGLRSQLSQDWLADAGIICPKVEGGFKSLRGFLLNYINDFCTQGQLLILSGMTGTSKTDIIRQLPNAVDLEGAANHKGSSFGRPLDGQPTQIDFENRVAIDLLRVEAQHPHRTVVLEDESRSIGGRHLPPCLADKMAQSPRVVIEVPFAERIEKLWQEYVVERHQQTLAFYSASGEGSEIAEGSERAEHAFTQYLIDSLMRVQKRLGGQRTKEILALMEAAIARQAEDKFASHRDWLTALTQDYYDPMYIYQLEKRKERVVFRGDRSAVMEWLASADNR